MKHFTTHRRGDFEPLHDTGTSQAAMMTLAPGEDTGESANNEHPWAEQWLYVVSGTGTATAGPRKGKAVKLAVGSLLFIAKGEPHVITNTGETPLVTLNIYAPPAYDKAGDPLYGDD
jgi:mannose-6-phosphate isomerase-like protein (cupin superfamily)